MTRTAMSLVWLVPLLPLLGFVLNGTLALVRPTAKTAVSVIGVGAVVAAFGVAVAVVRALAVGHAAEPVVFTYWSWMPVGSLQVNAALHGAGPRRHGGWLAPARRPASQHDGDQQCAD